MNQYAGMELGELCSMHEIFNPCACRFGAFARHRKAAFGATVGLCLVLAGTAAADRFVIKDNPHAAPPYTSWATAAGDIQTAVDAAREGPVVWVRASAPGSILTERSYRAPGETVWVRAGVFDAGGRPSGRWRETLTNRLVINKAVVVRSEHNDLENTIIRGVRAGNGRTNGPDAIRCVYIADGASLIGFTLTGGATVTMDETRATGADRSAGGVYAQSVAAVISNCAIIGNAVSGDTRQGNGGGGVRNGTYYNCRIMDNHTPYHGGGADRAVLFDCVISGNTAGGSGGGANEGMLYGCLVAGNTASGAGGGTQGGRLSECTLLGNRAGGHGGGHHAQPYSSTLEKCVLAHNASGRAGGGARGAYMRHCLVASNTAALVGPGLHECILSDSVLMHNDASRSRFNNCLLVGCGAQMHGGQDDTINSCTIVGSRREGIMTTGTNLTLVYKTISWDNGAPDAGVRATDSCGIPGPRNNYDDADRGNTTNPPPFAIVGEGVGSGHRPGDYRLRPGASIQAGCNLGGRMALAGDLENIIGEWNPRVPRPEQ